MKPYLEKVLNENTLLRGFSSNIKKDQLVWHRDADSRLIVVVEGTGWQFQRDNNLPVMLNEGDTVSIKAGEYHRLIKGDTDLVVIIKEGIPKQYKADEKSAEWQDKNSFA
jgi:quercetin dioxygenase-like cupin family protein